MGVVAWEMALYRNSFSVLHEQQRTLQQDREVLRAIVAGGQVWHLPSTQPGAAGSAIRVAPSQGADAIVFIDGIPPATAGRAYAVWVADAADAHPLLTFQMPPSGTVVLYVHAILSGATAAMVTLEPSSGLVASRPGPTVLLGQHS